MIVNSIYLHLIHFISAVIIAYLHNWSSDMEFGINWCLRTDTMYNCTYSVKCMYNYARFIDKSALRFITIYNNFSIIRRYILLFIYRVTTILTFISVLWVVFLPPWSLFCGTLCKFVHMLYTLIYPGPIHNIQYTIYIDIYVM